MLGYLQRFVHRRPAAQTLSAYAHEIDQRLETDAAFTTLTSAYQAATFGAHPEPLAQAQAPARRVIIALVRDRHSAWLALIRKR